MKALLDTNIIIHRETHQVLNQDIGILFKWLDKGKYLKCIHPVTVQEINKNKDSNVVSSFNVKLDSYYHLKTTAPLSAEVQTVSDDVDKGINDTNDTILLNEVFCERVDVLITEDKKIHRKAKLLGIADNVFTINSFLEKIVSENPDLVNYKVLSVKKEYFGNINLKDSFFDSFREDYDGFDKWFNKKSDDVAYVTYNNGKILSFLYLKVEERNENYSDIQPVFSPKKRLKIGTFKVISNGVRLGERFLKIIFDNALRFRVEEIYVTIFDKRDEQQRLISLLEDWGFVNRGIKETSNGSELVLVRDFTRKFDIANPRFTYPYISKNTNIFLHPIWPQYHTELLPDSILTTESPLNFIENEPHRNAISKVFLSRSFNKDIKCGDIIVFYRTGGKYKGVVSTIAVVENVIFDLQSESEFILKSRKRSIFSDKELKEWWDYKPQYRPFIVNFMYVYSFPKRPNLDQLINFGVIKNIESVPRGFEKISKEQFVKIIKESHSDESIIVD